MAWVSRYEAFVNLEFIDTSTFKRIEMQPSAMALVFGQLRSFGTNQRPYQGFGNSFVL